MVGQYVTIHDDVISHVNISSVQSVDGGTFACVAENKVGEVVHQDRLNVYGNAAATERLWSVAVGGGLRVVRPVVVVVKSSKKSKMSRTLPRNFRKHNVQFSGTFFLTKKKFF